MQILVGLAALVQSSNCILTWGNFQILIDEFTIWCLYFLNRPVIQSTRVDGQNILLFDFVKFVGLVKVRERVLYTCPSQLDLALLLNSLQSSQLLVSHNCQGQRLVEHVVRAPKQAQN